MFPSHLQIEQRVVDFILGNSASYQPAIWSAEITLYPPRAVMPLLESHNGCFQGKILPTFLLSKHTAYSVFYYVVLGDFCLQEINTTPLPLLPSGKWIYYLKVKYFSLLPFVEKKCGVHFLSMPRERYSCPMKV